MLFYLADGTYFALIFLKEREASGLLSIELSGDSQNMAKKINKKFLEEVNMYKITFFAITIITFLTHPYFALADIDLPWSTTFNSADWNQYSDPLESDGLNKGGGWTASPEGYYAQITADANYSSGEGGKGFRHWIGDGTNNNSGGIDVNFNTNQTSFWVRWYMRWELGFSSNWNVFKVLYIYPESGGGSVFHAGYPGGVGGINFYSTKDHYSCSNCGFGSAFYTGGISDGSWQCFEIHIDIPNNTFQSWLNGAKIVDRSDVDFGDITSINHFRIGENCKDVSNGQSMYVDFDDIAISNAGYIGPLSGGGGGQDTIAPSVSISSPVQGQAIASDVTLSASASDNVGVSGVQFKIDGADFGSEETTPPYSITIKSTALSDGSYTLTALARDAAGNQTTSAAVDFTVNTGGGAGAVLFSESFEDTNFTARGWYDNTNLQLTTAEHIPGSTRSLEFHFNQGATTPTSGGAVRKKFSETDQIYLSYYVKYSANWEGSNQSYHPHQFYILTNLEGDWSGLANTHLTTYIEQNEGKPLVTIQDSLNIDQSKINIDLTSLTETRAVAGCNGDSDGYGNGDCYSAGSAYKNGKQWKAGNIYFQDTPGTYYKNNWHFIEAFIKLNSITSGKANADGIIQYWYDDQLIIDHSDVVLRTGQHPNMKFNQFVIGPYIGDGSPVSQTLWLDDLNVATSRANTSTSSKPSPPTSLKVVE